MSSQLHNIFYVCQHLLKIDIIEYQTYTTLSCSSGAFLKLKHISFLKLLSLSGAVRIFISTSRNRVWKFLPMEVDPFSAMSQVKEQIKFFASFDLSDIDRKSLFYNRKQLASDSTLVDNNISHDDCLQLMVPPPDRYHNKTSMPPPPPPSRRSENTNPTPPPPPPSRLSENTNLSSPPPPLPPSRPNAKTTPSTQPPLIPRSSASSLKAPSPPPSPLTGNDSPSSSPHAPPPLPPKRVAHSDSVIIDSENPNNFILDKFSYLNSQASHSESETIIDDDGSTCSWNEGDQYILKMYFYVQRSSIPSGTYVHKINKKGFDIQKGFDIKTHYVTSGFGTVPSSKDVYSVSSQMPTTLSPGDYTVESTLQGSNSETIMSFNWNICIVPKFNDNTESNIVSVHKTPSSLPGEIIIINANSPLDLIFDKFIYSGQKSSKVIDKPNVFHAWADGGDEYRMQIDFYVQKSPISLTYRQKMYKKGISITPGETLEYEMGTYSPGRQLQSCTTPVYKMPSGLLKAGKYKVESKVIIDHVVEAVSWKWNLQIYKD